jgi:hypothetical protein
MSTRTAQPARRRLPAIAAAAAATATAALLAGASPATAQARAAASIAAGAQAAAGGTWGTAEEVPGSAALNTGGNAVVQAVSCPSAGNCAAGGYYTPAGGSPPAQVFVVSEVHGTWRKAEQIPGTAALNTGGSAQVNSVSCASAGNCSVGGYYAVGFDGDLHAFVANEVNGTWGKAKQVAAALNVGGGGGVDSVSCASAGNCIAGGAYNEGSAGGFFTQAFVVSQVHGTWGKAKEVPGTDALNTGGGAAVTSVSCTSASNCSAGGYYATDATGFPQQAFVVTQTNGTWGKAKEVPGTAALNAGGSAQVTSVSCASAGNCSAGGSYEDSSGHFQMFVISQVHGTWDKAKEIPGTAALNAGGFAQVTSVSCASAGNCSVGGFYKDASGNQQGFLVSQVNGSWGTAKEVPGIAALNPGGSSGIAAVSCASPGNCDAGGSYTDTSGNSQVFVASQMHGTWDKAEQIPGSAALNTGGFAVTTSLSCAPAGTCSAGGIYASSSGLQAFIANKT